MISEEFISPSVRGAPARVFRVAPKYPRASIIVIHQVWGFDRDIQEACLRLAREGYAAYAPLLFWQRRELLKPDAIHRAMQIVWDIPLADRYMRSRLREVFSKKDASPRLRIVLRTLYDRKFRTSMVEELVSLAESLADGREVGAVGYSMGGGLALRLASKFTRLRACAVYSSEAPSSATLRAIAAPILALYGCDDDFMTPGLSNFLRDAVACGKTLQLKTYPSAGHGFFDPHSEGFSRPAAEDSWNLLLEFLARAFREQGKNRLGQPDSR